LGFGHETFAHETFAPLYLKKVSKTSKVQMNDRKPEKD
jgi:hypothetical protein